MTKIYFRQSIIREGIQDKNLFLILCAAYLL